MVTTLLSGTLQPPLLTLLSSTSAPSLSPLFRTQTDPSLPAESYITSIPDSSLSPLDTSSAPSRVPKHPARGEIIHDVIHIQSPSMGTTYIQAGCSVTSYNKRIAARKGKGKAEEGDVPLGVEVGWVGMQLRRLGRREFTIEAGFVDSKGREGVVRCSTFKVCPVITCYCTE